MHLLKYSIITALITLSISQAQETPDPIDRIYTGDIVLLNASDVEEFADVVRLNGNLYFGLSLPPRTRFDDFQLRVVTGDFHIRGTNTFDALRSDDFPALDSIGGDLLITDNKQLREINSFANLDTISGNCSVANNKQLTTLQGFANLKYANNFSVLNNPRFIWFPAETDAANSFRSLVRITQSIMVLNNASDMPSAQLILPTFDRLIEVGDLIQISQNPHLRKIASFQALTSVGSLIIQNNTALTELKDLPEISMINALTLRNNPRLDRCCATLEQLTSPDLVAKPTLSDNMPDCNIIFGSCPVFALAQPAEPLSPTGGTYIIPITTNVRWQVAAEYPDGVDEWITIAPAAGKGDAEITLTYGNNNMTEGFAPRAVQIRIEALREDGLLFSPRRRETLDLEQISSQAILALTQPMDDNGEERPVILPSTEGSASATFISNVPWLASIEYAEEVATSDPWVTIRSDLSGSTGASVMFDHELNPNNEARKSTLSIAGAGIVTTVDLVQAAGPPRLEVTPPRLNILSTTQRISFDIDTNLSFKITTEYPRGSIAWLTPTEGDVSDATTERIVFLLNQNITAYTRTATIRIQGGTIQRTFAVQQAGTRPFIGSSRAIAIGAGIRLNRATFTFTVPTLAPAEPSFIVFLQSSLRWRRVVEYPENTAPWLPVVTPESDFYEAILRVLYESNFHSQTRTAKITIIGTNLDGTPFDPPTQFVINVRQLGISRILGTPKPVTNNLNIGPNPVKDNLQLRTDTPLRLLIYDVAGNQVLTQQISSGNTTVDLSYLPNGVYVLHAEVAGRRHQQRLIKQ